MKKMNKWEGWKGGRITPKIFLKFLKKMYNDNTYVKKSLVSKVHLSYGLTFTQGGGDIGL